MRMDEPSSAQPPLRNRYNDVLRGWYVFFLSKNGDRILDALRDEVAALEILPAEQRTPEQQSAFENKHALLSAVDDYLLQVKLRRVLMETSGNTYTRTAADEYINWCFMRFSEIQAIPSRERTSDSAKQYEWLNAFLTP